MYHLDVLDLTRDGSPHGAGVREIWVHAVAAKAGGGVTYLRSVVPELVARLEGRGVRLVLLLPQELASLTLPSWVETHRLRAVAGSGLARLVFDQLVLPVWLTSRPAAALFCSGNFAPVVKTARTVLLVRNAIYFEPDFLRRETWGRRLLLRLKGALIRLGATGCASVHYPSQYMRQVFEGGNGRRGEVNPYGIGRAFLQDGSLAIPRVPPPSEPYRFLLVMNYTLQKNLTFVLRALAMAKVEGLRVRVIVTSKLKGGPRASRREDRSLVTTRQLVESGHLELVGPCYGRELIDLYRACDACLVPSICESFAHPLVEAMALGKPLICADRPYAHEMCEDAALYVDPDRPEELLRLWREWPAPVSLARPRSREELLRVFSWSSHVSRLLADLGLPPA